MDLAILIIGPDAKLLKLIAAFIGHNDMNVVLAQNQEEAKRQMEVIKFDFVIWDSRGENNLIEG